MNRYLTGRHPGPNPDPRPFDPVAVAAGLGAVALAPAAVAVLRLFPPLWPDAHGAAWLLPLAGVAAAVVVALCMTACLVAGLREGSERAVMRAAGLGLLAVGLGVAALRALSVEGAPEFPDGGISAAAVGGGLVLLLAQLSDRHRFGLHRWPLVWVGLFVALEAGLAVSLLIVPPDWTRPWLLGTAAALVAASALPGPWLAAGLVTAGLAALAAARPGSIDGLPGLAALAGGSIGYVRGLGDRPAFEADAHAAQADDMLTEEAVEARIIRVAPGGPAPGAEEGARLARELRGTIEELIHARRTIELQREEISQAAAVDALTGTASRRAILDRLRVEASEARRYQHPVALVLLDLDDFSRLNHERGMRIGDEVLAEVALRLRLRVRAADALGRIGGDSFLVLLPHTDETGAATFADALRRRLLSRPVETSEGELQVGVSIGVAFMPAGAGLTDEELLAAADEALASARAAGGNRIAFDRAHGLVRLEERRVDGAGA